VEVQHESGSQRDQPRPECAPVTKIKYYSLIARKMPAPALPDCIIWRIVSQVSRRTYLRRSKARFRCEIRPQKNKAACHREVVDEWGNCPSCRNQSVIHLDDAQIDEARVVCRICGTFLDTLAQHERMMLTLRPAAQFQLTASPHQIKARQLPRFVPPLTSTVISMLRLTTASRGIAARLSRAGGRRPLR
jgi:hypothetical protein